MINLAFCISIHYEDGKLLLRSIYDGVRKRMPRPVQQSLTKLTFRLLNKPIYDDTGNQRLPKAVVVISADFELAWAWRFATRPVDALAMGRQERDHLPVILKALNERDIPITWATVGHLFLDSCERCNGRAHDNLHRPKYFSNAYWNYDHGDWYDIDPCGNYKSNPEFYCPDLIERIMNSKTNHEIGCHSFSHCDFNDVNSYPELIHDELQACEDAMKRFGLKPESFVFPGNQYGSFDILKQHDYKVIRYKTNEMKEIGYPEKLSNGLTAIHDSFAFDQSEEGWDQSYLFWRMKKYVERAVQHKAICHMWFHPSIPMHEITGYFVPMMDYLENLRAQGLIEIKTMRETVLA